jgi:hypothetical protein
VKQRLAAIRHLFDWLVTGQVVPIMLLAPAALAGAEQEMTTRGEYPAWVN